MTNDKQIARQWRPHDANRVHHSCGAAHNVTAWACALAPRSDEWRGWNLVQRYHHHHKHRITHLKEPRSRRNGDMMDAWDWRRQHHLCQLLLCAHSVHGILCSSARKIVHSAQNLWIRLAPKGDRVSRRLHYADVCHALNYRIHRLNLQFIIIWSEVHTIQTPSEDIHVLPRQDRSRQSL